MVLRGLIIAAFVGFPIAACLAWIYDFSEGRVIREADLPPKPVPAFGGRKADFVVIGALAVALVLSLVDGLLLRNQLAVEDGSLETEAVSALITDLENETGDPVFDGSLEPVLRMVLEDAPSISAFDRTQIARILGVRPPDLLNETSGRQFAVNQGMDVVVVGSIRTDANAYRLSFSAVQAVTGEIVSSVQGTAVDKAQVLSEATKLIVRVRDVLDNERSESARFFAMSTLSTSSLDAVHHWASGLELAANGELEQARQELLESVRLDPNFGMAYQSLSLVLRNLGRTREAETYIGEALKHLDSMTERERRSTRGNYFRMTSDYEQCVTEFEDIIERYTFDIAARNQHALCLTLLRRLPEAVGEMERVVELVPTRTLFRINLSLYQSYAGDFENAERTARAIRDPEAYSLLALALAQTGQGRVNEARATYGRLAGFGRLGESLSEAGLADIAAYEGRFTDALRLFEAGVAADLESDYLDRAAAKLVSLAHVHLARGDSSAAIEAAERAIGFSDVVTSRFLAARAFVLAGDLEKARREAEDLATELQLEPQTYASIVEAMVVLQEGDAAAAVAQLRSANDQFDTWIGHYELARAYLEAGAFAQSDSELELCLARSGEVISLFLDESPTYMYLPPVLYQQGRARQELQSTEFPSSYRAYLSIRGDAAEDPLLSEIRQRVEIAGD